MSEKPDKTPKARSADRQKAERDSFLETMESLIVAFILAFVFRAYVVEAFVIPTGSMAPRLNGQHLELTCANCGYHYRVGLDSNDDKRTVVDPDRARRCPLCRSSRRSSREDATRHRAPPVSPALWWCSSM